MTYVFDSSAILAILLGDGGTEEAVGVLRGAGTAAGVQVLVPSTAMAELELYLLRRLPGQIDETMSLVSSWPIQIVESYPQWRHQAVQLQATLNLSWPIARVAALASLHQAKLVYQDPAFDAIPGLKGMKIG